MDAESYAIDGPRWRAALARLAPGEHTQVLSAVDKYLIDRTRSGLKLKRLQDTRLNLYSFRASEELRVIVEKIEHLLVLVDAGHHDPTYERAKRMRRVLDRRRDVLEYVLLGESREERAHRELDDPVAAARPPTHLWILDHWTDLQLQSAGLSQSEVEHVRTLREFEEIASLDGNLADRILDLATSTPEQWATPALDEEAEAERRLRALYNTYGVLAGLTRVVDAGEARRLAAAPIEDWMVFLHPDQRDVALRRQAGPAYVRGGPGTGKTVVALHRAVELAGRLPADRGRILFTTFVRTLPEVFQKLHARIPGAVPDRVEFIHVDELARRFLEKHGGGAPMRIEREIDAAYSSALRSEGPWRALVDVTFTSGYLKDEIRSVIKGRGIDTLDDYLSIARVGRRTPMQEPQRRAVWALREAWDAGMKYRGTVDYNDRVRIARDTARALGHPSYAAAIIDEAQDISQIGVEFVHALLTGGPGPSGPDQLLIVGDGAQRVYPGGFRLLNAGVDVRGRTTVLRLNFRTTRQIMEAALAIAGGVDVEDIEEDYRRGDQLVTSLRDGPLPSLRIFDDRAQELTHVVERIRHLVGDGRDPGDILVAVSANWQAEEALAALRAAEVPAMALADYDGVTTPYVKVGTNLRSKGLEFKVVFVPHLNEDLFPRKRPPGQTDEERAEERAQGLARLFVAMTRARDLLFLTAGGDPIIELQKAESLLEWRV